MNYFFFELLCYYCILLIISVILIRGIAYVNTEMSKCITVFKTLRRWTMIRCQAKAFVPPFRGACGYEDCVLYRSTKRRPQKTANVACCGVVLVVSWGSLTT